MEKNLKIVNRIHMNRVVERRMVPMAGNTFETVDCKKGLDKFLENIHCDIPKESKYDGFSDTMKYVYRGVSDAKHELIPAACRDYQKGLLDSQKFANRGSRVKPTSDEFAFSIFLEKADNMNYHIPGFNYEMREIVKSEKKQFSINMNKRKFHAMAIAQHYGLPTKLLDWSLDFKVALYFALMPLIRELYDDIFKYKLKEFKINEKYKTRCATIWALAVSPENYQIDGKLSHSDLPFLLVDPPRYGNDNMAAQKGVFTYWEDMFKKDECVPMESPDLLGNVTPLFTNMLHRLDIPVLMAPQLLIVELIKNSVSSAVLFPGLQGVAESFIEKTMCIALKQKITTNLRELII